VPGIWCLPFLFSVFSTALLALTPKFRFLAMPIFFFPRKPIFFPARVSFPPFVPFTPTDFPMFSFFFLVDNIQSPIPLGPSSVFFFFCPFCNFPPLRGADPLPVVSPAFFYVTKGLPLFLFDSLIPPSLGFVPCCRPAPPLPFLCPPDFLTPIPGILAVSFESLRRPFSLFSPL